MRLILAAALFWAVFLLPAMAQEQSVPHNHPPEDAAIHELFYSGWMRPDAPHISCCSKQDCYPAQARFREGTWFVKHRETGNWLPVPPEKIEHNLDNPDGRNHACISPSGHVFCFIAGGGI